MERGFLQREAELSKFNAFDESNPEIERTTREQVIPHVTERFDPNDPLADWSGHVPRTFRKKTFTHQSKIQSSLQYDAEGGIMGSESGQKVSSKRLGGNHNESLDPTAKQAPLQSAVYQLGPGERHTAIDWKTSASAAPVASSTLFAHPKKRMITPMYEQAPVRQLSSTSATRRNKNNLLAGLGKSLASSSTVLK